MFQRQLTENEKRVLLGLVSYPTLNDRQLSKKIKMKMSTVISIRQKLENDNYFKTVNLPALQDFGCELLSISFDQTSSLPLTDDIIKNAENVLSQREIVHFFLESNQSLLIQFSKDYTEAKSNMEAVEEFYKEHGNLRKGFTSCFFPFRLSRVFNYFDYRFLLSNIFNIQINKNLWDVDLQFDKTNKIQLSEVDKKVLLGTVRYPEISNIKLSDKISVSRISIGKKKREFEKNEIIKTIKIPNLKQLSLELLVVMYGKLNRNLSRGLKYYVPELLNTVGPVIFAVVGKNEIVTLSVFENFTTYRESHNTFLSKYKEHELFADPPQTILFSIKELRELRSHAYFPLLSYLIA